MPQHDVHLAGQGGAGSEELRVLAELQRSCESGAQLPLGWCKGIHCHAMQPCATPHLCSSAHTPNSRSSIRPAPPLALSTPRQQERTACNIYRCSLICTSCEATHPIRTLSTRSTSSLSRTRCRSQLSVLCSAGSLRTLILLSHARSPTSSFSARPAPSAPAPPRADSSQH